MMARDSRDFVKLYGCEHELQNGAACYEVARDYHRTPGDPDGMWLCEKYLQQRLTEKLPSWRREYLSDRRDAGRQPRTPDAVDILKAVVGALDYPGVTQAIIGGNHVE